MANGAEQVSGATGLVQTAENHSEAKRSSAQGQHGGVRLEKAGSGRTAARSGRRRQTLRRIGALWASVKPLGPCSLPGCHALVARKRWLERFLVIISRVIIASWSGRSVCPRFG